MKEAEHVEGKWMLEGQPDDESAVLIIDRYGLRIQHGVVYEGEIYINQYGHAAYLTGPAVTDLRRHLDGLWQCDKCNRWMRGAGICALCWGEG